MSVRTPAQAIAQIQADIRGHVNIGLGMCQKASHDIYGIGSGYESAYLAWLGAKYKHTDLSTAPVGAFVYMDGGHTLVQGKPAGHVMINAGNGKMYTPGGPTDGVHWYLTTINDLRQGWPWHHYVGWTEDNNGVRVPGLAPFIPTPVSHHPHLDNAAAELKIAVEHNSDPLKSELQHILDQLIAVTPK